MKRKELKPGEWYISKGCASGSVCFAVSNHILNGDYLDTMHYKSTTRPDLYHIHGCADVTPCDPPAWFGDVWVSKRKTESQIQDTCQRMVMLETLLIEYQHEAAMWKEEAQKKGGSDE